MPPRRNVRRRRLRRCRGGHVRARRRRGCLSRCSAEHWCSSREVAGQGSRSPFRRHRSSDSRSPRRPDTSSAHEDPSLCRVTAGCSPTFSRTSPAGLLSGCARWNRRKRAGSMSARTSSAGRPRPRRGRRTAVTFCSRPARASAGWCERWTSAAARR